MSYERLLARLQQLEQELHQPATRRDRARMSELLHPAFVEFGRSGRRYDRADVMDEFSSRGEPGRIHADDFSMSELADGVALLTYTSSHVDANGAHYRYTLRSSLWVRMQVGWQLRFHQGTPADVSGE